MATWFRRQSVRNNYSQSAPIAKVDKVAIPILPGTVSPVFFTLQNYVIDRFPAISPIQRFILVATAYYLYCADKKDEIFYNKNNLKKADADSSVVEAFKRFATNDKFGTYVDRAETYVTALTVDNVYAKMHYDLVKELKPRFHTRFTHELAAQIIITLGVSVVLFFATAAFLIYGSPESVRIKLYDFGAYLQTTFKPPVGAGE